MDEYESLSHTTWVCKYHVVFIPKCRRKTLYQELRRHLGEVFRTLALQKESKVEEGHLMPAFLCGGRTASITGKSKVRLKQIIRIILLNGVGDNVSKFMLPWSFSEGAAAEKHMAQLQHNMWVTNARSSVLSIITGGGKWIEMTIPADALYQHFLMTAERRFWRCVQTGQTPSPYGVEPPRPRIEGVRIVDMSEPIHGASSPVSSAPPARLFSTMNGPNLSSRP